MAVTSITFDNAYFHVPSDDTIIEIFDTRTFETESISMERRFFSSVMDLYGSFGAALRRSKLATKENVKMQVSNGYFIIQLGRFLKISLPNEIAIILGLRLPTEINDNSRFYMSYKDGVIYGKQKMDPFIFEPHCMMLYADCVISSIVGSVNAQIARVFPVPKVVHMRNRKSYVTVECKEPHFIPLASSELTQIHFSLRDIAGRQIPFFDQRNPVTINCILKTQ